MLISWIAAFLTDRQQAVRTGATLSDWKFLKGGLPQGVKLGVIFFFFFFFFFKKKKKKKKKNHS